MKISDARNMVSLAMDLSDAKSYKDLRVICPDLCAAIDMVEKHDGPYVPEEDIYLLGIY